MNASASSTLQVRTNPRALASLLLAGAVAAAILLADHWLDGWSEQHQLGTWFALWAVGVIAIGLLRGLTRRLAQAIMASLDAWFARAAQRRADERLWAMAQNDARLMAELQTALTRNESRHEVKDIFALAQRRADRILAQRLFHF